MNPSAVRNLIDRAMLGLRQALRGRLKSLSHDRVMLAQVEGLAGEKFQKTEYLQMAGFRSRPLPNAEMVIIPLHGKSAHGVVVTCANGKMFKADVQDGESVLFNETDGHFIHLKNGKIIDISCDTLNINAAVAVNITSPSIHATASTSVTLTSPQTTMSGRMDATDIYASGTSLCGHHHTEHDGPNTSAAIA